MKKLRPKYVWVIDEETFTIEVKGYTPTKSSNWSWTISIYLDKKHDLYSNPEGAKRLFANDDYVTSMYIIKLSTIGNVIVSPTQDNLQIRSKLLITCSYDSCLESPEKGIPDIILSDRHKLYLKLLALNHD